MHGSLSERGIDAWLRDYGVGRVGFVLEDEVYIMPINHASDGARISCQALPGTNVNAMRQNPTVAFGADEASSWNVRLHRRRGLRLPAQAGQ